MDKIVNKVNKIKKKKVQNSKDDQVSVDILSEVAMINAYYICHNVQDLMWYR